MFFKRAINAHQHQFQVVSERAKAVWSKRGDPGDEVRFRGRLLRCLGCGAYRFRAPGLREVEVEK